MRRIEEKDIRQLRREGNVTDAKGDKIKPFIVKSSPKSEIPPIEKLITTLSQALLSHDKQIPLLIETIRQSKSDIKIPTFPKIPPAPEPIKDWKFTVTRDSQGDIETIRAQAE